MVSPWERLRGWGAGESLQAGRGPGAPGVEGLGGPGCVAPEGNEGTKGAHSFPSTAGFSFRPQPARSALGAARQPHVFPLLGEGREEGSPEGDLGVSGVKLLFLLSVASNLGLSSA